MPDDVARLPDRHDASAACSGLDEHPQPARAALAGSSRLPLAAGRDYGGRARPAVDADLLALQARLADAERDKREAEAALARMTARLAAVTEELQTIRGSTMWRVLEPLGALLSAPAARPLRMALRLLVKRAARLPWLRRFAQRRSVHRAPDPAAWFAAYRDGFDHAAVRWRGTAKFSIVMPVYRVAPSWLDDAIASVARQTYPHWELICVDDGSADPKLTAVLDRAAASDARIQVIVLDRNQGVAHATNRGLDAATGEFVLLLDHDDALEPHALARFADAAAAEAPDLIYADEAITGDSLSEIRSIQARPAFAPGYYLSYPYFVHPVAIRLDIVRGFGGMDASLTISQDIDFVLRALESARKVTHIPDILYRWRTSKTSAGHRLQQTVMATTARIKTAHLHRLGFAGASVADGASFNTYRVRYFAAPAGRVLAVIPTRNQGDMLRRCIDSLRETCAGLALDILVIDHDSTEPATRDYLADIAARGVAQVMPYRGAFNFSAMNNAAVRAHGGTHDFYLLLNNDIEATRSGWLAAMQDVAMRGDVGAVGATLLYPDGRVQHAGVVVGMHDRAEHAFKTAFEGPNQPGYGCCLHATREYSAVTAACMLVPARAWRAAGGFDETLAVGFGDTDFCLRLGQRGLRVLNCADAVLLHHESVTRGQSLHGRDPHPRDTGRFCERHHDMILHGDPLFSPLLDRDSPLFHLAPGARLQADLAYRSVTAVRPLPPSAVSQ